MKAKMIHAAPSGFGLYQIEASGSPPFSIPVAGLKRRADLEGLVEHGGEGGKNLIGRVYEDQYGALMVRVG